jgi:hypothetical protein
MATEQIKIEKEKHEKAPLIYSSKFFNYLRNMSSVGRLNSESVDSINRLINQNGTMQDISFIDITDTEDEVTLIPIDRVKKLYRRINCDDFNEKHFSNYLKAEESIYSAKDFIRGYSGVWSFGRVSMKIGKLVKKLLPNLTDSQIEQFVNQYKTIYRTRTQCYLELISGKEITIFYNSSNYTHSPDGNGEGLGTLGKSCMRYGHDNFFKLYEENSEVCQMIVLRSKDKPDGILGRALVWRLTDGRTYLDRIYCHFDSDVYIFLNYAKERGWETHYENVKRSSYKIKHFQIQLKTADFNFYPYLDSFCYLNIDAKILYNHHDDYINTPGKVISCRNTGGGFDIIRRP